MALQAADIVDLVTGTLRKLGRGRWTDLTTDLQDFPTAKLFMKKSRMSEREGRGASDGAGGYEFQWQLQIDHNHSARTVGLGAVDNVDIRDTMISGTHPYRHVTGNYAFELREPIFNSGPAAIFDLVKSRKVACDISQMVLLENQLWKVPAPGSTDLHGFPFWIVKSATAVTTNQGLNGLVPSGYTTVGGINPSTGANGRWKNFAGPYTAVTVDDIIPKIDQFMDVSKFIPAVETPTYNTGDDYQMYTTRVVRQQMKALALAQNDNLGFDLDPANGKVMFRRVPFTWVPQLDEDTTNPIYGINWGVMKMAVLPGWWMRPTRVEIVPGQHTMTAVHIDTTANTYTTDRRRHWVLSNGTTMPA